MLMAMTLVREETYTFTPEGKDAEIHVRSGALREFLLKYAMDKVGQLHFPAEPLETLVAMHGLEAPRMASMTLLEAAEPVIVGMCADGTFLLLDGGHRRWFWAKRGVHTLRGWAVPEEVWSSYIFDPKASSTFLHHEDGSQLPQRKGR